MQCSTRVSITFSIAVPTNAATAIIAIPTIIAPSFSTLPEIAMVIVAQLLMLITIITNVASLTISITIDVTGYLGDIITILAVSGFDLRNKLDLDALNDIFAIDSTFGIIIDDNVMQYTMRIFASTTQSGASGVTILMVSLCSSTISTTFLSFSAIDSTLTDAATIYITNTVPALNTITIAITITSIASVGVSAPTVPRNSGATNSGASPTMVSLIKLALMDPNYNPTYMYHEAKNKTVCVPIICVLFLFCFYIDVLTCSHVSTSNVFTSNVFTSNVFTFLFCISVLCALAV